MNIKYPGSLPKRETTAQEGKDPDEGLEDRAESSSRDSPHQQGSEESPDTASSQCLDDPCGP